VLAGEPRDHGRPPGGGLEQRGLQPDVGQQPGDELRRLALPRSLVLAVVRGVDPQQVLADADDLVLGGGTSVSCWRWAGLGHGPTVPTAGVGGGIPERAPGQRTDGAKTFRPYSRRLPLGQSLLVRLPQRVKELDMRRIAAL